jgi:glycosyltransferase involved in cell wall biosynthesis
LVQPQDSIVKFSICIPNYNYASYLGRTIQSVLSQSYTDFEILVSDNASTDKSVEVARSFADPRIHVHINRCNVGFAGNLDRAARPATGTRMIMLSSDDLVRPEALATYRAFCDALGPDAERDVFTSTWDVIDPEDRVTGRGGPEPSIWTEDDRVPHLDAGAGGPVYGMDADKLLRRCLQQLKNPFNFAATCYSRELYDQVEGYGGGRLINPDKAFNWKLLGVARRAYFIDRPLFAYRWHGSNQVAQESGMGAMKSMVDQYVATLELDAGLLARLNLSREDICNAFVEYDVARHGLATLARGNRTRARRILQFGWAVYPGSVRHNRNARILATLLRFGPVGERIAKWAYARHLDRARR